MAEAQWVRVDATAGLKLLDAIRVNSADLRDVFRGKIDQLITRFFEMQFATEGAAGGEPWAPISPTTSRLRKRRGHGHEGPTAGLRDTNVLWGSYTKAGGPDSVRVIDKSIYIRGSAVAYAGANQKLRLISTMFGRRLKKPRPVPARPVLPEKLPPDLLRDIEIAVMEHVVGQDT